jgi:hypothetical protein
VPLQAEMTTQATTDTRKESPKEKTKDKRKEPPKKKTSKTKKHHKAAGLVPTKLKKYVAALLFWLATAATGIQDLLIMKSVCFLTDNGAYGHNWQLILVELVGLRRVCVLLMEISTCLTMSSAPLNCQRKVMQMWLHMMCSGRTWF